MEKVCQAEIIPNARKNFSILPYSGPLPTQDHSKVVIERENVISEILEKTL